MLLRRAHLPLALLLAVAVAVATALAFPTSAEAADFDDTRGQTYAAAVDALAKREIILGCEEGRFCPERALTRGQLAAILVRALDLEPGEPGRFGDTAGHEHEANIDALAAAGITNGCGEDGDDFCPNARISRQHVASMLVRAFGVPKTGKTHFNDVNPNGTHAVNINSLAEAGISAGCTNPMDGFCPHQQVTRWQAAYFVARALHLVDRVTILPLREREQLEAQRLARIEARKQAEAEAKAQAAATSEREAIWDRLAQCESGGNWSINTGNGYYGGLQFSLSSWRAVGGSGYPHQHSRAEQIYRGERLQAIQGWGAWPACSRKLGLT